MAHTLTGMANSNGMMPIYPAATNNQMYDRSATTQSFTQLDTKPVYPPNWVTPYSEDTSPIDTYGLEQAAAYLPSATPMTNNTIYGATNRWTYPTSRYPCNGSNPYYDPISSYPNVTTNGLPYIQTSNMRTSAASEALSPLNMSSLSMSLPERPHPRHYNMMDGTAPQRQLPMPQPSPAQTSRNVVDQLQDQRLRSGQVVHSSSASGGGVFAKPLLPWSADNDTHVSSNAAAVTSSGASTHLPTTTDGTLNFLTGATTMTADTSTIGTASQLQYNFSSSSLLDAMNASAPTTSYSTFREHRPSATQSQLPRHDSQTNLYSFSTDSVSKRDSLGDGSDCKLVNGQRYTPLPPQQQQAPSGVEELHRESLDNRNVSLHRSSMGNLNSSF